MDLNVLPAERATLHPDSPMWGEHRSRYHFAADFVNGKTVLDIACGTGFGEQILIDAGTSKILATDYSEEALQITKKLNTPNTFIFRSDGTRLPFSDNSIEVITSFETVEHIENYEDFVADLRRVLRKDGVMIMSTPNALYTKPIDGIPKNPFHVYEFTPTEYKELLLKHFSDVKLFGQRVSERYRICPYWELPEMLPTDPLSKFLIIVNKLQSRLPISLRESLSQKFQNKSFYPGEMDFIFTPEELHNSYVQVAVCRP